MSTLTSQVGKFEIVLNEDESRVYVYCKGEEVAFYNCSEDAAYLRYAAISNFLLDVERCVKEDPTVFEWVGTFPRDGA